MLKPLLQLSQGAGPKVGSLFWANDILFRYTGFNPTDIVNTVFESMSAIGSFGVHFNAKVQRRNT